MSNTVDTKTQRQNYYNEVVKAGVDQTTGKINTALGNNVNTAAAPLDAFLHGQGKDTTKVDKDILALNTATQANDSTAYAKAAAQLAIDLGTDVESNIGGLTGATPGKGGLTHTNANDTSSDVYKNSPAQGSDSFRTWLNDHPSTDDQKIWNIPGANTTMAIDYTTGKIAAFDTSTGTKQNLPDWVSKGQHGTLILNDGSRFDIGPSSDPKRKMGCAAVSGDQLFTSGSSDITTDPAKVASYLGGSLVGNDTGNVSVAAKHPNDDKYGYATMQPGGDLSSGDVTFRSGKIDKNYSMDDLSSSNAEVVNALRNPQNKHV